MLQNPLHQFFRTTAQPCPYLEGQSERKVLTELASEDSVALYNRLSRAGFRRSRSFAYRPACVDCTACIPVRIVVAEFLESRSLKRIRLANHDLTAGELPARATLEQYRLFTRYLGDRHNESDMAEMSYGEYRAMVEDSPIETKLVTLRDTNAQLKGVCLIDVLDDGVSAVYSYYEPDQPKRSIGSFLILSLIEAAKRKNLPYVYLGYWIADSRKMAYKTRFRPLEKLARDGWHIMQDAVAEPIG